MNRRSTKRHLSDSDCDICKSHKPPNVTRSVSWTSETSSLASQLRPNQRNSVSTLVTPLLPVPLSSKARLPVNKKISFPVIKPKHERLQGDFYKLRHTLTIITSNEFQDEVSRKKALVMKKDSAEHRQSPFDEYLERLKLKEELPWRQRVHSNKVKDDKPKARDRRVCFHLD